MDATILHIHYGSGEILVKCDNFFPCTKISMERLLNIVDMDYFDRWEHVETIMAYLQGNKDRDERLLKNIEYLKRRYKGRWT